MLTALLFKILINFVSIIILGLIYYFFRRDMAYCISSILIGMTTFALVYVLGKNEFGIATGLGLFAIFGIIRYRTEQVPIIEMTFLFICITISVVYAIADELTLTIFSAIFLNATMIIITGLLLLLNRKHEVQKIELLVDSIDWVKYDPSEQIKYLSEKSSFPVIRFNILHIDHLKEISRVVVFYTK